MQVCEAARQNCYTLSSMKKTFNEMTSDELEDEERQHEGK